MKIAVIGAGIAGIACAYELAKDGHDVVVFEKAGAAAEGASFGPTGLIAPSLSLPFSHPAWPTTHWMKRAFLPQAGIMRSGTDPASLRWLFQWKTVRDEAAFVARIGQLSEIIRYSKDRLAHICNQESIEFERSEGLLVLYRNETQATRADAKLSTLKELGITWRNVTPTDTRIIEPGLSEELSFARAVHFPQDEVGNCRQFALALRARSQELGVRYCFDTQVDKIAPGRPLQVHLAQQTDAQSFDHVILCSGEPMPNLMPHEVTKVRSIRVTGYSFSASVNEPLNAPRGAVHDAQAGVTFTRTGNRVRVSGGFKLGVHSKRSTQAAVKVLYDGLLQAFPGAAKLSSGTQTWQGSVSVSQDGLPHIGPTQTQGLWLNTSHGANGWAVACGAARLIADGIRHNESAVDMTHFAPGRT